ncbi:putative transcriptional regulator [Rhypophila sp. PSN 637]
MDQQQQARGRSPSATSTGGGHNLQQPHIKNSHSPSLSPARFPNPNESVPPSIGLGLGVINPTSEHYPAGQLDFSAYDSNNSGFLNNQQSQPYSQPGLADPTASFDSFKSDDTFGAQTQGSFQQSLLAPTFGESPDFTIFPVTAGEQQFSQPLFANDSNIDPNMMAQNHNPTPPHLLASDSAHQPGSANHSPSFNQHQFPPSAGRHSRNVSLGPEAALLPGQIDWSRSGPQFQGHRRSPSEYSDVSSAAPSPHLVSSDTFEPIDQGHSPMQRPQDAGLYQELHGIGSFSISDHHSARSPSHSPAISPRILPQQLPDQNHPPTFLLQQAQNNSYGPPASFMPQQPEAFPQLPQDNQDIQGQMPAPPSINIDFAPAPVRIGFEQPKSLDIDSLTPPERGRPRASRQRAVTDPYSGSGGSFNRSPSTSGSLSPNLSADSPAASSRSLSPLDRSGSGSGAISPNRRRQSTSAVQNNAIALRLADPDYNGPGAQGESGPGGAKRVQKHPATFQCTLCPKRFTRAYNLRSHLRTHTDERPFVCTVCGKAFARQHDRKRHEGLHSGEKKFVCKGDLKGGGQWGCGRRFARADALGRHFRSEAGRICIKPLLDEEMLERQRVWNEQRMQHAAAQGMVMQPPPGMMMAPGMDPNTGGYPMDANGNFSLPQALLQQYPALAQIPWTNDMGGGSGMDDDISGRSSFDASDYDDEGEGGYVSGPGTGFGPGGMQENFGDMGYASDYGNPGGR